MSVHATGSGKESSMMEMILRTSGLATLRDQATLFILAAPDQLSDLPAISHALEKGSLPNIQTADLPVVRRYEMLTFTPRRLVTILAQPRCTASLHSHPLLPPNKSSQITQLAFHTSLYANI